MKINELKQTLVRHPSAIVRFVLPSGERVPAHAHVTEVARIDKRFIDCGGTIRTSAVCQLQTWHADDVHHRLTAGKLAKILDKAAPVLDSEDLDVAVEHEAPLISQFPLESLDVSSGEVNLRLGSRHTACLAECNCQTTAPSRIDPLQLNLRADPTPCCAAN